MKRSQILALSLIIIILAIIGSAFLYAEPKSYETFIGEPSTSLIYKGRRYIFEKEMPDSALVCFSIIVNRFDSQMGKEEKVRVVEAYNRLWYLYFFIYFDYVEASNCLKKAADISDAEHLGRERIDLNYGCMYQLINEQSPDTIFSGLATEYFKKALTEADISDNEDVRQYAMANLLAVMINDPSTGGIEKEWERFNKNSRDKDSGIYRFNTAIYNIITLIGKEDYEAAMSLADATMQTMDFSGDNIRCKYLLLLLKARIYFQTGHTEETLATVRTLERISDSHGLTDSKMETYRIMSDYLSDIGNDSMAYQYKVRNLMLKDSILNHRQLTKISELQFLGEIHDMKSELTKSHYRERAVFRGLIVTVSAAVMVSLFLFILWNRNKKLNESYLSLYKKNEELIRQEISRQQKSIHNDDGQKSAESILVKYAGSCIDDDEKISIFSRVKDILCTSDEIYSDGFCIARLAFLTGIKEKILSQVINEIAGCNFTSLVNHYRVNEACSRISDTDNFGHLTLESIGNSVGFKSRSAFIAAFKSQTGLTPSEYKKQAKADSKG